MEKVSVTHTHTHPPDYHNLPCQWHKLMSKNLHWGRKFITCCLCSMH